MNKQTMELLQFVVLCLSIGTTIFVTVSWYNSALRKQYAAQRDFEHLKRNYQQMSEALATFSKENDRRFDETTLDLRDLKSMANAILLKVATENSIGWQRPQ